ncbi:flagellar biosynthetic protein FliR [Mesorhizobium sp. 1B3]|uniref:flagellar biosynthetic protein FliR n=1 Tax=Mesorhizobium sp. 1B3 TaxID=3243599 RepID=UPI003D968624
MIIDPGQLVLAAFLAFCRIGACFMVMPGLSSIRVPMQVRLFMAIAVAMAILANVWDLIAPYAQRDPNVVTIFMLSELLIGVLIGLLARLYLLALQFIGSAIAMLIGYGGPGGTAIEEVEPQPALATLISFSALLLLFALDFHHEIVKALLASYRILPPGTLFNPQSALVDVTDTISESFLAMLRLGSPFIAYAILVNLAIGFVNKLTPQIPVYFVSLPFLIAGGLILIYLGIGPFLRLYADGFVPMTIGR